MLNSATDTAAAERPTLDTRVKPHVRIIGGTLDEDGDSIIISGRIDPSTFRFLKVDKEYQRPLGNRGDIWTALKAGVVVPPIDIGVRGQDFESDGDDFVIRSPAYIIDGWQRVGTALRILELNPETPIRIFGTVHFDTDNLWERHRFTELNKNVKKVSPNLHLRNMRDSNEAILTLFGLSNNTKDFVLYKKVSWSQNMHRNELMTALSLTKIAVRLHRHVGPSMGNTTMHNATAAATAAKEVSLQIFRKNTATFFSIIDDCWGIRAIEYRRAAPQIKGPFLQSVASIFSDHLDFWQSNDRVLHVPAGLRRKLASFPIRDPQVANLAGSGGAARTILREMIISHLNKGRRTGHLRSRYAA